MIFAVHLVGHNGFNVFALLLLVVCIPIYNPELDSLYIINIIIL